MTLFLAENTYFRQRISPRHLFIVVRTLPRIH